MRTNRWILAGLLLLAACDRPSEPRQSADSSETPDRSDSAAAVADVADENEDTRVVWPGPNGGERYRLGAEVAMLEMRISRTAPQVRVWIWNSDLTALLPVDQPELQLQIAPIEREGAGRPGNFTLRLQAPTQAERRASGETAHFLGGSPRMRGLRTFEAQLGPLNVRGHDVGGTTLRYPYARVADPAEDD